MRIKAGYYLKLLTSETKKSFGRTKSKISKDENSKNVANSETAKAVLSSCNNINNDYQQESRVLCTLIPNKSFNQLLFISPQNFMFLETFHSDFLHI